MSHFSNTRSIHAGRQDLSHLGVHAAPLDFSTTYPIGDLGAGAHELEKMAHGNRPRSNPIYARLHNPTVGRFEDAMAQIEGGEAGRGFELRREFSLIFKGRPLELQKCFSADWSFVEDLFCQGNRSC